MLKMIELLELIAMESFWFQPIDSTDEDDVGSLSFQIVSIPG